MIHFYVALALTLVAVVAGGFALRDHLRWQRSIRLLEAADLSLPTTSASAPIPIRLLVYLLAIVIALIAPVPFSVFYKATIGLALVIFLLMELFLTVPGTPTILRTGTNSAIYFVLWLGFVVTTGSALWSLWGLVALIPIALALLCWWLWRAKLGYLAISVIAYMVNATLVLAFAATLAATHFALWSLLTLFGSLLLVGVDLLRGWEAFRAPVRNCELYQLTFCLLATLLLAWSTWGTFLPTFN